MKRRAKRALWILAGVGFVVAALFNTLGLYVLTPRDAPPDGVTLLINRRGTGLPLISSLDGQLERRSEVINPEFVALGPPAGRTIARFPYSKSLYLRTTGNVELIK